MGNAHSLFENITVCTLPLGASIILPRLYNAMTQLGGIWATNQNVSISYTPIGGTIHATVAADCLAACTIESGGLNLIGGIPPQYRPSTLNAFNVSIRSQDVTSNGTGLCSPAGDMTFVPALGWKIDSGTTSGLPAQTFIYQL